MSRYCIARSDNWAENQLNTGITLPSKCILSCFSWLFSSSLINTNIMLESDQLQPESTHRAVTLLEVYCACRHRISAD